MSMFNKPGVDKPASRSDASPAEVGLSVIAAGMKITGDIESSGVIKLDGIVEGAVRGARQLLLGRSGSVKGDVYADEAILGGSVTGTIFAKQRIEVQGTSRIHGDIHTKSIVVLEGAVINGAVRMDDQGVRASTPSQPQRATLALSQ